MKLNLFFLISLFLFATCFASYEWVPFAGTSLFLCVLILALLYMVSIAFNLNDLKFLATEESYQLIVTLIIIVILGSSEVALNTFSSSIGLSTSLQNASIEIVNSNLNQYSSALTSLKTLSVDVGKHSSTSAYCSFAQIGFGVSPCGAFSPIGSTLSMGFQAISVSVAELGSLVTLLKFGKEYAFSLILPLGIILRTFKFSRGAGGLFLGLGVSLYLFLPLSTVFMDIMTSIEPYSSARLSIPSSSEYSCDVKAFDSLTYSLDLSSMRISSLGIPPSDLSSLAFSDGFDYTNFERASNLYVDLYNSLTQLMYLFLIKSTLVVIVSTIVFFLGFRWVSKTAGAEVDISGLMRLS